MNILVLFGGESDEYEISLLSAAAVLRHFPAEHTAIPCGISRAGDWFLFTGTADEIERDLWQADQARLSPLTLSLSHRNQGVSPFMANGAPVPVDVVFPVLHGGGGEDGSVQGLLEMAGVPYVGCRVKASALALDKVMTKILAASAGIPVLPYLSLSDADFFEDRIGEAERVERELSYPVFVKPRHGGSSKGTAKAVDRASLLSALEEAYAWGEAALVEPFLEARELEFAILSPAPGRFLGHSVGEIEADGEYYDYDAKYRRHSSRLFIPAEIPGEVKARILSYSRTLFRLLGCRTLARFDYFLTPEGELLLNEVNTLPGFTSVSMYPILLSCAGYPLEKLIDVCVKSALT